jgi:quinol monooxygenase YgiN
MAGVIVISAYRPNPGQEEELDDLVAEHVPALRAAGFVTARPAVVAKAKDGTVVEIFEWASPQAIELAHADEMVRAIWERFESVCETMPVGEVAETKDLFSAFTPVDAPKR